MLKEVVNERKKRQNQLQSHFEWQNMIKDALPQNRNVENMHRCQSSTQPYSIQVQYLLEFWARYPLTKSKTCMNTYSFNNRVMENMKSWYNSANKAILGCNSSYRVVTYISNVSHDSTWCSMVDDVPKCGNQY